MRIDFTTDVVRVAFNLGAPDAMKTDPANFKAHTFRVPRALKGSLSPYDKVVVQYRNGSFAIATVVETNVYIPNADEAELSYIAARWDATALEEQLAINERTQTIKSRLQNMKEQFEKDAIYEMLAQKSPEAAALLKELKELREGTSNEN